MTQDPAHAATSIDNLMADQANKFDLIVELLTTKTGLIQLALLVLIVWFGLWFAVRVQRYLFRDHPERRERLLTYLFGRLALPVCGFVLALLAIVANALYFKADATILTVGSAMLFWLGVTRLAAALVRTILPKGKIEQGTEHSIAVLFWLGFIAYQLGFDGLIFSWLDSISFHVGKNRLTALMILSALLWVSVIMLAALWVSRLIDKRIMLISHVDLSFRIVISKLVRTGMIIAAVLIALPIVGIDLTVLSVFGGALGVGLGFGLQKIASNYVSGFIILLDRSVRIGDRVTVDGAGSRTGIIQEITSRYVVLRQADGTEALIPNETLISNTVVNTSYSDRSVWQSLEIGVAYGSDLRQVMALMVEATTSSPRVLQDPAPTAFVTAFADSSINLTLGYWVGDPENGLLGPKSAINLAIWDKFVEHGIQIPFPQREVRVLGDVSMIPQESRQA
ncbi:mechanosensitive ion channel family protein [Laribacter hongkongensis]|uniref:Mechanosensitive ion channel protein MscS n=1 Tax=Laribacter hongkongensis TaxID=168471 RepID=A0A248LIQ0_9NEIS|nr:mechanosensitive ion channel domain-containing protein [Laribacter hongkongensis]ASJ24628.1 mechanosensitive ion channel protein MscS [Laribacter hongkongensis]MBE5527763.1 mechanosensitive ion channel protein MscS [Laribacter hongkongensis]MCG8994677.1 mechanosensitive ion channel [Laribacter hongkongensis]MCG9009460.1 mechanosensitive ion channel [Laribacter hongkongensis]MCG9021881.1 mechanosensitive ion channel [Laribacter hongkongensis]